jgi:hypothetical protein
VRLRWHSTPPSLHLHLSAQFHEPYFPDLLTEHTLNTTTSRQVLIPPPFKMCIAIVTSAHPDYPFILLNNRDVLRPILELIVHVD